ncbi:MAG: nucleotide sugar dehydrogenase [Oscillospiraceae bacterium]|jgi:UDPglucose 6-dehydrogenase|nr:nucleotide sugar dehydrogenase [Oscillospiraceae bacterium]
MKIAVIGIGYVGFSNAVLFAKSNEVVLFDIDKSKIEKVNNATMPFELPSEENDLLDKETIKRLYATDDKVKAYTNTDVVIISVSTDSLGEGQPLNTTNVESVISDAKQFAPNAVIVIRSTIPIGFTKRMNEKYNCDNIIFVPEFLRENKALYDTIHPTRVVVGDTGAVGQRITELFKKAYENCDVPFAQTSSSEAEAVKLFSNTYLAMRVAFFNELDTYALENDMDSKAIITGLGYDPRIGDGYNNPSLGYGGYCLPKDSQQLAVIYSQIPSVLIKNIIESNKLRKEYMAQKIMDSCSGAIGFYRLTAKANSDSFRASAVVDVIKIIKSQGREVLIYEPLIKQDDNLGVFYDDLQAFANASGIIVANRITPEIEEFKQKIFSRDCFNRD